METPLKKQPNNQGKLILSTSKGMVYFLPEQIIRLQAKSNYTRIYFTDHFSLLTAKVLKEFEPLLMPAGFLRTHKSHLVNRQYITMVCNNGTLIMNDHSTAGISKRRKAAILKSLKISGTID